MVHARPQRHEPHLAGAVRRVAMLGFEGAQSLDVTGPLEVFARANALLRERGDRRPGYATELLGLRRGPFACSSGLRVTAERAYLGRNGPLDTLLIAGGEGVRTLVDDARLCRWLRRMQPRVRRLGSICSGAFVLAAAGLLDGRRATTHWRACAQLAERYPHVRVERDPIFVKDGPIYTSAGVTAGMDLALAMVEEDLGRKLALEVARELVMFVQRPGGQSQFSAQLSFQLADSRPLRELQAFIAEHVEGDLSVTACAKRTAMSPRSFARRFRAEVGTTPAAYVEAARVEAARRLLEETERGVEQIAQACGFGSAETMRRAFLRGVNVTPADYRERFRKRAS